MQVTRDIITATEFPQHQLARALVELSSASPPSEDSQPTITTPNLLNSPSHFLNWQFCRLAEYSFAASTSKSRQDASLTLIRWPCPTNSETNPALATQQIWSCSSEYYVYGIGLDSILLEIHGLNFQAADCSTILFFPER
jgi:hypothetical protein